MRMFKRLLSNDRSPNGIYLLWVVFAVVVALLIPGLARSCH